MSEELPPSLVVEIDEPPTRSSGYREVKTTQGRFKATYQSKTMARGFLTIFMLFWNAGIAVALWTDWRGFLGAVFPILHLALGVGLSWFVLAAWLNRSVLAIENGVLSCTRGPLWLPFRKTESIALALVDSFRVQRRELGRMNDKPIFGHVVVAEKKESGDVVQVTDPLPTSAAADFLKQRFERHRTVEERGSKVHVSAPPSMEAVVEELEVFDEDPGESEQGAQ